MGSGSRSRARRARGAFRLGPLLIAFVLALASAAPAGAARFHNFLDPDPFMVIPSGGSLGIADPYPSTVRVTGLPKRVRQLREVRFGPLHTNPEDMDVLLVGPGGQHTMLMSDACGGDDAIEDEGYFDFDDRAAKFLPTSACKAGRYKPTNYATDPSLPSPAPPFEGFGYAADLSVFEGTDPNGIWRLFVYDDSGASPAPGGLGVADGFGLDIHVPARCRGKAASLVGADGRGDVLGGRRKRDVVAGLGGPDLIFGARGNDLLCGGKGRDDLYGGPGRDVLVGGPGGDELRGGNGNDLCIGGPGRDTAVGCERRRGIP